MVIFCVYTRERAKKPPNSEACTRIEKKTFAQPSHHPKKTVRDYSLAYTYTATGQRNHSLRRSFVLACRARCTRSGGERDTGAARGA